MRRPSLYPDDRRCLVCGTTAGVELHHVLGGVGRRPVSDREGAVVFLCHEHHQGPRGPHMDASFREWLRADCQRRWEEREGLSGEEAHDAFRRTFGVSYL